MPQPLRGADIGMRTLDRAGHKTIFTLSGNHIIPLFDASTTDLVRSRADIGKVTSITVLGGNSFGLMSPIITGYVVALTGSFDRAFFVAGVLPLIGALVTFTMTRRPIQPQMARVAEASLV